MITACITLEHGTTLARHADEMRCFVQSRMQWCVVAKIESITDESGLALAPKTTRYHRRLRHPLELQAVRRQQSVKMLA
jgi:hypothetical protein